MAQHGPSAYEDAGSPRPLICIANLGDKEGNPRPEWGWSFCSKEAAFQAVDLAEKLFSDMELVEPANNGPTTVALLNQPFGGSFVLIQHFSPEKRQQNYIDKGVEPPAHIMIEVNRGLFVGDQSGTTEIMPPDSERINEIRQRLYQWTVGLLEIFA